MEKYPKKYKNTKCTCSYFICNIFRIFFVFLQKKIRKKYKKIQNYIYYILYAFEDGPSPCGTARDSRQQFHEGEENHGEVQPVPSQSAIKWESIC